MHRLVLSLVAVTLFASALAFGAMHARAGAPVVAASVDTHHAAR